MSRGGWRTFQAWTQLTRVSGAPTAVADVLVGAAVTGGATRAWLVTIVAMASMLFYAAGMVLNDYTDIERDGRERPDRPLPSGAISARAAGRAGWTLLAVAWGLCAVASVASGALAPLAVATSLALAIVAYDLGGWKERAAGPLLMGACRGLNVALGLSLAAHPVHPWAWWPVVVGVTTYIVGVTFFSRSEAATSRRPALLLAAAVQGAGVAILAAAPWLTSAATLRLQVVGWWLLWSVVALSIARPLAKAIMAPDATFVQRAVGHSITSLVLMHAATALGLAGPKWGLAILALLPVALVLRQFVRLT